MKRKTNQNMKIKELEYKSVKKKLRRKKKRNKITRKNKISIKKQDK